MSHEITDHITTVQIKNYPLNDLGNGKRFADYARDKLAFIPEYGSWFIYSGKCWERTHYSKVRLLAEQCVQSAQKQAETDFRNNSRVIDFLEKCQNLPRLDAMIKASQNHLCISIDEFDKDPFKFNCASGTIELLSQKCRPHSPADRITQYSPVEYDPMTTCPRFDQFLDEIFFEDKDLIALVLELLGYALSGDCSEQIFIIFRGDSLQMGANGKGTLIETVRAIYGPYAKNADILTLMVTNTSRVRVDRARLVGARFVTAGEPPPNKVLDTAFIKTVTGQDKVTACYLYQAPFEFLPQFKLFISCNRIPRFDDESESSLRRVIVIPFPRTFSENERDNTLRQKLLAELPGILNRAIAGFKRWREKGFTPSATSKEALEAFRNNPLKQQPDTLPKDKLKQVKAFIEDECVVHADAKGTFGSLFSSWGYYCSNREIHKYDKKGKTFPLLSKNQFAAALTELGFQNKTIETTETTSQGKTRIRTRYRLGVCLLDDFPEEKFKEIFGETIKPVSDGY